ncbi:MAG TPA: xanthine dehydrogenase family protein subunit M, partial [Burkholderiaceae bacterium]|nr:xanthine dehydrogenase family protein subunit M [Burkholderiaceae bacterium]
RPWRRPQAEAALTGRPLDAASMEAAADALLQGAAPLPGNAYKLPLARRAIARALQDAAAVAA